MLTHSLTLGEARALAARFAPPRPPKENEPVRHWLRVRALLESGPKTYRDVARELSLNPYHANTLMVRLRTIGLIEVHLRGKRGNNGHATSYRLKG